MRRVVLHIGTHKTGTSAIQQFLDANADALNTQGFCFPRMEDDHYQVAETRNGHFLYQYAEAVVNGVELSDEILKATGVCFKRLSKLMDAGLTVILSDERLWASGANSKRIWLAIKDVFEQMSVDCIDIVVYLRKQDEFIASMWNQSVKGQIRTRQTLRGYAQRPYMKKIMDYDGSLKALEEVFGREHLSVCVFSRSKMKNRDIRHDFCSLLGIEIDDTFSFEESETNASLSNNLVEIKRQANFAPMYREMGNFLCEPAKRASELRQEKDNRSMCTQRWLKKLMKAHEKGNARVAYEYFDKEDGKLFDQEDTKEYEKWSMDDESFTQDMIRFFVEALTEEHVKRLDAEKRVAELMARVDALE